MPSFNRVIIVGHLTRDPALKYLPSQTALAEFGVACNRKYKTASGEQREDVLFLDCAAFGKAGETLNQYVKKGDPILLEGRLKYDSWEDKQTGQKRNKISLVVENFQFLGSGKGEGQQDRPTPRAPGQRPPAPSGTPPYDETTHGIPEEEIPF